MPQPPEERLQKALARLGLASRREAEDWIRAGRLTVNGVLAHLGMRIRTGDQIRLDGRLVRQRAPTSTNVFLYHRSPGDPLREPAAHDDRDDTSRGVEPDQLEEFPEAERTAAAADSSDPAPHESADSTREHLPQGGRPKAAGNVWLRTPLQDRLPKRAGRRFIPISPMPNVDGGLELLSSDGELAERLQRAVRTLQSEFSVRVHGELGDDQRRQIREGVLDRGVLEVLSLDSGGGEGSNRWYTIQTLGASGKDVRQLFERQGAIVSRIMRTRLGTVSLGRELARGQFRKLTNDELEALTSAAAGHDDSHAPQPQQAAPPRASLRRELFRRVARDSSAPPARFKRRRSIAGNRSTARDTSDDAPASAWPSARDRDDRRRSSSSQRKGRNEWSRPQGNARRGEQRSGFSAPGDRPARDPDAPRRRFRDQSARGERPNDGSADFPSPRRSHSSRSFNRPRRDDADRGSLAGSSNRPRREGARGNSFASRPDRPRGDDMRRNSSAPSSDRSRRGSSASPSERRRGDDARHGAFAADRRGGRAQSGRPMRRDDNPRRGGSPQRPGRGKPPRGPRR